MLIPNGGTLLPKLSVRVFDAGQGDPHFANAAVREFCWEDLLSESWPLGRIGTNSQGEALLEYRPELGGLTQRPSLVPQDTLTTGHTFTGTGTWEHRYAVTGRYRVRRLWQIDTRNTVHYRAPGRVLPENPHVVFSLALPDTPADWSSGSLGEPFVRIEFGEGQGRFGLYFGKTGQFLQRWNTTTAAWVSVASLPSARPLVNQDQQEETFIYVCCDEGKLLVSLDFGESYLEYGDGSLVVPSARYVFAGQGGMAGFGCHQMRFFDASYESPEQPTDAPRVATPTFTADGSTPGGSDIDFDDLSDGTLQIAAYRANFIAGVILSSPWNFYTRPVLKATKFQYAPIPTSGSGDYTTPWNTETEEGEVTDSYVERAEINKPRELGGGSCSIWIRLKPDGSQLQRGLRWRKIQVFAGLNWWDPDTETVEELLELTLVFTGYVARVRRVWDGFGNAFLELDLWNGAALYKRRKWDRFNIRTLGGQSLNDALDEILTMEGRGGVNITQYREWHTLGNAWMLPVGSFRPRRGESLWRTMNAMVETVAPYGLELGIMDNGAARTVSRDYLSGNSHEYTAKTGELSELVLRASIEEDYTAGATAIDVEGELPGGGTAYRWQYDPLAEYGLSDVRYCPWRDGPEQETLPDQVNPGLLNGRSQAMAYEFFRMLQEADVAAIVNPDVTRGDLLTLNGCTEIQIPEGSEFRVIATHMVYEHTEAIPKLETTAGLEKRTWD